MPAGDPRQQDHRVYELQLTLLGLDPPIWRRIAVPATITLVKLHRVIQATFDWTNAHLHEFVLPSGARYEPRLPDSDPDPDTFDERGKRLRTYLKTEGDTLLYRYDFGDDWEVKVELSRINLTPGEIACLAGEFAAPPDDSGGVEGYVELLAALSDSEHPDHDDVIDWLDPDFDPWRFDRDRIDRVIRAL